MIPIIVLAGLLLAFSADDSAKYAKEKAINPDLIVSLKEQQLIAKKSNSQFVIPPKESFENDELVVKKDNANQKKYHIVKTDENLTMISLIYGIPLEELISKNNIKNPHLIQIGTKLKLM